MTEDPDGPVKDPAAVSDGERNSIAAVLTILNEFLRSASLYGPLHSQIDYVDSPEIVSTDLVGNRHAGIVDGRATITAGDRVVLYVWYDNEFGYSCQVVRVLEEMANVHPPVFPAV